MSSQPANSVPLVKTGIEGLDDVLQGGLPANRLYLLEGNPGSGKTTLALQFLREGVRAGEPCLLVTLSETGEELRAGAASHGWSLDGINILEIMASDERFGSDARYTMYHSSEVELTETTKRVLTESERLQPKRIVLDSLSELRLLAEDPLRYRRQILALKQFFSRQQCTVIFIDDRTGSDRDKHLHSLAHGVISLETTAAVYGTIRRQIHVVKLRGRKFREGFHDYVIRSGGLEVFPRLVAAEHVSKYTRETLSSGLAALDNLLGGGLAKGTSTLIMGPAGTGKSSVATLFALAQAKQDEHSAFFMFDESIATYLERSAGLGWDVEQMQRAGKMSLRQIDPAELSPGEFTALIRRTLIEENTRLLVIDSLNGYLNSMPDERFLLLHLHELLTFLGQQGVTTLMTLTQHGIIGETLHVPLDASYLADAVVLLRYFEALGAIRQAISVTKKRTGKHERAIRELSFSSQGISVGEPVDDYHGVMGGNTSPLFRLRPAGETPLS